MTGKIFIEMLLLNVLKSGAPPYRARVCGMNRCIDPAKFFCTSRYTAICFVWDTGIGIPKEQHALVFERFHRVRSNAFTTTTEGVGIGLHVARSLAHLMGGDIDLQSEPERGSRFTLSMRLWDQAKAAKLVAEAAAADLPG